VGRAGAATLVVGGDVQLTAAGTRVPGAWNGLWLGSGLDSGASVLRGIEVWYGGGDMAGLRVEGDGGTLTLQLTFLRSLRTLPPFSYSGASWNIARTRSDACWLDDALD
jgi:hypothetical protein